LLGLPAGWQRALFPTTVGLCASFAEPSTRLYRLIEICGLTGTLIADESAVYNPREPNDRLLLGVKGTLSEAELFTLRTRL